MNIHQAFAMTRGVRGVTRLHAVAITGLPKGFKRFEQKFPQPWANLIVLNWT